MNNTFLLCLLNIIYIYIDYIYINIFITFTYKLIYLCFIDNGSIR